MQDVNHKIRPGMWCWGSKEIPQASLFLLLHLLPGPPMSQACQGRPGNAVHKGQPYPRARQRESKMDRSDWRVIVLKEPIEAQFPFCSQRTIGNGYHKYWATERTINQHEFIEYLPFQGNLLGTSRYWGGGRIK